MPRFLSGETTRTTRQALPRARTLAARAGALPGANLALISVPGEFAAPRRARRSSAGLHALVFSDNVPLEDELALKRLAREKGLLLMGPDCGTALIGGTPLAFANAVPRGDIGIDLGLGHRAAGSVVPARRAWAAACRTASASAAATSTSASARSPRSRPSTRWSRMPAPRTIVLISKPPAPSVAEQVLQRLARCRKKSVVCFLGLDKPGLAPTLRAAAEMAASASGRR